MGLLPLHLMEIMEKAQGNRLPTHGYGFRAAVLIDIQAIIIMAQLSKSSPSSRGRHLQWHCGGLKGGTIGTHNPAHTISSSPLARTPYLIIWLIQKVICQFT